MGNVCRGFEFPGGSEVKNLPEMVGKISWSRKCQPTPVFLPGESQGQRSLAGYSPWGDRELDTTELPSTTQHNFKDCEFSGSTVVKNPPANAGVAREVNLIPGLGRSPGGELQYSCLENSMDRRDWWATIHAVSKSQTRRNIYKDCRTSRYESRNFFIVYDSLT